LTEVQYGDHIIAVARQVSEATAVGLVFHFGHVGGGFQDGQDWVFEIGNGYEVTLRRRGRGERQIGGLAANGLDPKDFNLLFSEFIEAVGSLTEIWEPAHWAARFPLGQQRIRSNYGEWTTVVNRGAVLAAENDLAFFDLEFRMDGHDRRKFLKLYIPLAELGNQWNQNLVRVVGIFEHFLNDDRVELRGLFDQGSLRESDLRAQER
jgi:hypothetical protein